MLDNRRFLSAKHWRRMQFRCLWVVLGLACVVVYHAAVPNAFGADADVDGRQLASSDDDEFDRKLDNKWLTIVYILLIMYMFLALAVAVDEFFVPALMVLCSEDYLDLSDDVAGATFMAAGGSAPELFTSFIGTFKESSVGFGTIVGSAVFNVLFVIGMCAVFSLEPLKLTWWPLFRDCTYYTFSLVMVFVFFGPVSSKKIYWWEALILLGMYGGYVLVMKYHTQMYGWLMRKRHGPAWTIKEDELHNITFNNHSTFRAGIVKILTSTRENIADTTGVFAVTRLKGDWEQSFRLIDVNNDGALDENEVRRGGGGGSVGGGGGGGGGGGSVVVLEDMQALSGAKGNNNNNNNGDAEDPNQHEVSFSEFHHWYVRSEQRIRNEMERTWQAVDANKDGKIDKNELEVFLRTFAAMTHQTSLSKRALDRMVTNAFDEIDEDKDGEIDKDEFFNWYRKSMFWQRAHDALGVEEEVAEPISIRPPPFDAPLRAKLFYLLTLPIVVLLLLTLPDTSREGTLGGYPYRRWAPVTFLGSIAWIGLFSYWMVDWAEVVGDTFSIPEAVMGLTFLAAGTSVPDLLSSVIVAKQGKGDMAVSSSIGSNIFDVTVGLPLPWLAYAAVKQKPVVVAADSLSFSLVVLMAMLVAVVVTVHVNGWVMTKTLGATMFVLYIVFVVQDLIFNFQCDTDKNGSYFDGC